MAITISRTLIDGATKAVIELVSTGDTTGGESGTVVEASELNNSLGEDTELLRVVEVRALVASSENSLFLTWDGNDANEFLTLPPGPTDMKIICEPTDSDDTASLAGDILFYTSAANVPFTLRLTVEKIRGFSGSTAVKWRNL